MFGGFLLGAAAAGAAALGAPANLRHITDNMEGLLVRLPFGAFHTVARKRKPRDCRYSCRRVFASLSDAGAGSAATRGSKRLSITSWPPRDRHPGTPRRRPPQAHRRGWTGGETPGLQLTGTELQYLSQADLRRHFRQRLGTDHARAQPAQIALGAIGKREVQVPGDHQVEYGIAEEFETFVIGAGRAAMSQGRYEQLRITRLVAQLIADPADGPVRARSCSKCRHSVVGWAPEPDRLVKGYQYEDIREQGGLVVVSGLHVPSLAIAGDLDVLGCRVFHFLNEQPLLEGGLDGNDAAGIRVLEVTLSTARGYGLPSCN